MLILKGSHENFFSHSQKYKMAAIDSEKMVFCTIMYHNVGVLDIIIINISIIGIAIMIIMIKILF